MTGRAAERDLVGTLTAAPDIREMANGNKIVLLRLRPSGRSETHDARLGLGSDEGGRRAETEISRLGEGDTVSLKGSWSRSTWAGASGEMETWRFDATSASKGVPPPRKGLLAEMAEGFARGLDRRSGRDDEGRPRARMIDDRAADYDPVAPRSRFKEPRQEQARGPTHAGEDEGMPESRLVGTLVGPVAHRRLDGGDRLAIMRVRPDGKPGWLEASIPLRRDEAGQGTSAAVSALAPGDRVAMRGLWHIHEETLDGRRRSVRDFRASAMEAAPPEPEQRTDQAARGERPPRAPGATTMGMEGRTEGAVERLADGRLSMRVRDAAGHRGSAPATVIVDPRALGMPPEVAGAIAGMEPGSAVSVRGGWQRSEGNKYAVRGHARDRPGRVGCLAVVGDGGAGSPDRPAEAREGPQGRRRGTLSGGDGTTRGRRRYDLWSSIRGRRAWRGDC